MNEPNVDTQGAKKIISIAIIAMLLSGGFLMFILPGIKPVTGNVINGLPLFAQKNEITRETYQFALSNPDALNGAPCSCGCMMHLHDGRIHKRGLLDCFMKEDGSFDEHASSCDMCLSAALDVKAYTEQGLNKEEIISRITDKYGAGGGH